MTTCQQHEDIRGVRILLGADLVKNGDKVSSFPLDELSANMADKELGSGIINLWKESFGGEESNQIPCVVSPTIVFYLRSECCQKPVSVCFAAPAIPKILGEYPYAWYLYSICTDPHLRRKGLCKALLGKVISEISSKFPETKNLVLAVKPDNVSYKIYTDFGFRRTGDFIIEGETFDVLVYKY